MQQNIIEEISQHDLGTLFWCLMRWINATDTIREYNDRLVQ